MTTSTRPGAPPFDLVSEVDTAGLKVAVVRAALELGLFDHVHAGRADLPSLANAMAATERGTQVLVRALLSLGLLVRGDQGALACGPVADAYLRAGAPTSFAPILLSWLRNRDRLVDALRGNRPPGDHASDSAGSVWRAYAAPDLVRWRDSVGPLQQVLHARGITVPPGGAVLDLGCGSGLIGLSLVADAPGATVVAVDRAEVLEVTRALAAQMALSERLHCVEGDVRTVAMSPAGYDVVLLTNVAQYLTDVELLDVLKRARTALRPEGMLQLSTPVIDHGSPELTANWNTAVEMFLSSPDVDLRDDCSLRQLFHAAGFDAVDRVSEVGYVARTRPAR